MRNVKKRYRHWIAHTNLIQSISYSITIWSKQGTVSQQIASDYLYKPEEHCYLCRQRPPNPTRSKVIRDNVAFVSIHAKNKNMKSSSNAFTLIFIDYHNRQSTSVTSCADPICIWKGWSSLFRAATHRQFPRTTVEQWTTNDTSTAVES